jgi:hypothetical protein
LGDGLTSVQFSRAIDPTVGVHLGLAWAITPAVELGAGYKPEWLDGVNYGTFDDDDRPEGRGGKLIHGPFARLSFGFPRERCGEA